MATDITKWQRQNYKKTKQVDVSLGATKMVDTTKTKTKFGTGGLLNVLLPAAVGAAATHFMMGRKKKKNEESGKIVDENKRMNEGDGSRTDRQKAADRSIQEQKQKPKTKAATSYSRPIDSKGGEEKTSRGRPVKANQRTRVKKVNNTDGGGNNANKTVNQSPPATTMSNNRESGAGRVTTSFGQTNPKGGSARTRKLTDADKERNKELAKAKEEKKLEDDKKFVRDNRNLGTKLTTILPDKAYDKLPKALQKLYTKGAKAKIERRERIASDVQTDREIKADFRAEMNEVKKDKSLTFNQKIAKQRDIRKKYKEITGKTLR